MDLIPKPDQLVAAASNLATGVLYGGVADLRPMARTQMASGDRWELYHYRPRRTVREDEDPVLLVTPLAAPAICYDLRRGCSLVEHLVEVDRPTYLVEYSRVSFADRALGMEHWVDGVVPDTIREVSRHAGGRPVHVVGWSLGGIFSLLAAAGGKELPIASIVALGSPADTSKVPIIAPIRPILSLDTGLATRLYRMLGGAPQPFVRAAFQLSGLQSLLTKPFVRAMSLDDRDHLAQLEAVERFMDQMTAYPGRTFGQIYHRMIKGNELRDGALELGGRFLELSAIDVPVLVVAGNTDGIAPIEAVRPLTRLLSGSPEVRLEIVPGGHLGLLTGRAARSTTWPALDEWFDDVAAREPVARGERARTPAADSSAGGRSIGTDPKRRYGSKSSRGLAPQ
ncbi:alpha/beta hydrolase [Marmoricola endophyticus]|uniref:Alpha/beta hydrolase n=1 Tax=Marmoricola endophyticus TaxID=2040280 RepID=A0A917BQB8_9ACTN|nr:alpha/beta fold hydrolase [Marmoricola endophyticus]GGF53230.1 alpha/beta hydrolase [Marmoricola endophyticus]